MTSKWRHNTSPWYRIRKQFPTLEHRGCTPEENGKAVFHVNSFHMQRETQTSKNHAKRRILQIFGVIILTIFKPEDWNLETWGFPFPKLHNQILNQQPGCPFQWHDLISAVALNKEPLLLFPLLFSLLAHRNLAVTTKLPFSIHKMPQCQVWWKKKQFSKLNFFPITHTLFSLFKTI